TPRSSWKRSSVSGSRMRIRNGCSGATSTSSRASPRCGRSPADDRRGEAFHAQRALNVGEASSLLPGTASPRAARVARRAEAGPDHDQGRSAGAVALWLGLRAAGGALRLLRILWDDGKACLDLVEPR